VARAATTAAASTIVARAAMTAVASTIVARAAMTAVASTIVARAAMTAAGSNAGSLGKIGRVALLTMRMLIVVTGPSEVMSVCRPAICAKKSAAQGVSGTNAQARNGAMQNSAQHRVAGAHSALASVAAALGVLASPSDRGLAAIMRTIAERSPHYPSNPWPISAYLAPDCIRGFDREVRLASPNRTSSVGV